MKKIWIDTDCGSDCDDTGAVAIANILHNLGECEIIGMSQTTTLKYGVAALDTINKFYGNEFLLCGNQEGHYFDSPREDFYVSKMVAKFHNNPKSYLEYPKVIPTLRKVLAENTGITLVCIGQLNNLANLLTSNADELSPLTGVDLVKRSVKEIVLMGGIFLEPNEHIYYANTECKSEYNIISDLPSSKIVFEMTPVKTYVCDFKCGYLVKTGGILVPCSDENPIGYAYKLYCNGNRESWDLVTVYYAIKGDNEFLEAKAGEVILNDDGVTLWQDNPSGLFYRVMLKVPDEILAKELDSLLLK